MFLFRNLVELSEHLQKVLVVIRKPVFYFTLSSLPLISTLPQNFVETTGFSRAQYPIFIFSTK